MSYTIWRGTGAVTSNPHPFSLQMGSIDLIDPLKRGFGPQLDTINVSEIGANGASQMTFTYQDPHKILTLPSLARIQFNDHGANEVLFAGYVLGRGTYPMAGASSYGVHATCTDYSYLLDATIIPRLTYKAGHSDRALIQGIVANSIRHSTIYTHSAFMTQTNANMDAFDFSFMTLRAGIEAVASAAGEDRHYYIDFLGRLHYFSGSTESAMGAAPYVISDAPTGAQRNGAQLSIEYDDSQIFNAVYVKGFNAAGSGWVKDETSIKTYGLRQAFYEAPHSKTAGALANVGAHFLKLHKDPIVRGSFHQTGTDAGWRVGQTVTITNASLGISAATYPIKQIDTTFLNGLGSRERVIYFGELPASGRRKPGAVNALADTTGGSGRYSIEPVGSLTGLSGIAFERRAL